MQSMIYMMAATCALALMVNTSALAQSGTWKYGFELGWTNSKIQGDLETNEAGMELETQQYNAGFHLSFYARRHFTDLFGLQFGLSYAQRGGRLEFNGPSQYVFGLQGDIQRLVPADRNESLKIQNGYMTIPVLVFQKIGNRLELGAGAYAGYLVSSKSDGQIRLSSSSGGANAFETFFINSDNNYFKDEFGDATLGMQTINVGGANFEEPRTIGAYYEYLADPGESLFNRFDAGIMAQLGFYFNESLNLKGRFSYGLTDVTKKEADTAKGDFDRTNNQFLFRDDKDKSLSLQISIGFMF
jgi:hypothetical protein